MLCCAGAGAGAGAGAAVVLYFSGARNHDSWYIQLQPHLISTRKLML